MQPPQNPYGTPNPYESAQPSYNPYPPPSRGVSMDVIGEAWKLLQPNIAPWIGAVLIYGVITGIFSGLSRFTMSTDPTTGMPHLGTAYYLLTICSTLVGFVVAGALMKLAISTVRTGRADIGEMFNIGDVIANLIIAGILTSIAYCVGFVLCIIPCVIAALGLSMTIPLVVDQKIGAVDAIKASWEKCKPHLGALFVLFLVLGLINIGGLLVCGVGFLVSFPLTQIALALVYRDLFLAGNIGNSPSTGFGGPPPPIASPR